MVMLIIGIITYCITLLALIVKTFFPNRINIFKPNEKNNGYLIYYRLFVDVINMIYMLYSLTIVQYGMDVTSTNLNIYMWLITSNILTQLTNYHEYMKYLILSDLIEITFVIITYIHTIFNENAYLGIGYYFIINTISHVINSLNIIDNTLITNYMSVLIIMLSSLDTIGGIMTDTFNIINILMIVKSSITIYINQCQLSYYEKVSIKRELLVGVERLNSIFNINFNLLLSDYYDYYDHNDNEEFDSAMNGITELNENNYILPQKIIEYKNRLQKNR